MLNTTGAVQRYFESRRCNWRESTAADPKTQESCPPEFKETYKILKTAGMIEFENRLIIRTGLLIMTRDRADAAIKEPKKHSA